MLLGAAHTVNSANYFEYTSVGYASGSDKKVSFQITSSIAQTIAIDWDMANPGTVTSTQALSANVATTVTHTFTGGFTGTKMVRVTCPQPSKISLLSYNLGASTNQDDTSQPTQMGYFNNMTTMNLCGFKLTSLDLRPIRKLTSLFLIATDYGTSYAFFLPQIYSDGSGGIGTLNLTLAPYLQTVKVGAAGINTITMAENDTMTFLNFQGNNITNNINYLSAHLTTLIVAGSSLNSTKMPLSMLPTTLTTLFLGNGNNAMLNSTGATANNYSSVDVSACTALTYCAINGCGVTGSVTLPSNNTMTTFACNDNTITSISHLSTALTNFYAYNNKLTSSLISQVTACTGMTSLRLGNIATTAGQSGSGLGNNVDLSALSGMTYLDISYCGLTGSLTLPSTNVMTSLFVIGNAGLTSLNRIPTSVSTLYLNATALTSIPTLPTGLTDFRTTSMTGGPYTIDLSGNTTDFLNFQLANSNITSLTLPSASGRSFGSSFLIYLNAGLNTLNNLSNCNFPDSTALFYTYSCELDTAYPLGASPNGIKFRSIQIGLNDTSLTNVNTTIDTLYTNRDNFNNTVAKSLSIVNSVTKHQARPSGLLQMPSGFYYGVSNGTPASQMEKIWVLVNQNVDGDTSPTSTNKKYKWTIAVAASVTINTLLNNSGSLHVQLANATGIQRSVGQRITITNSTEATYNGTWTITSKISNSDYTLSAAYVTNTATGQLAS